MLLIPARAWATAAFGLLALAACGPAPGADTAPGAPLSVVTAFYPLEFAARGVGGAAVDVTSLTPPGVEPHDLELSAQQVAQIAEADLVVYVRGFQPAVDEAVDQQASGRAIDVSAALPLLADDPHVWLDPANMSAIGRVVADRIRELSPDSAADVTAAEKRFDTQMSDLDAEFAAALADCAIRDLVVSHEAFGYLAAAYGLTQVGISGLSPESEPSPARLKEVADLIREKSISTIYYETLVDPKVAQTIANETGATTAVLDPLEGLADGAQGDYTSVMRANLAALVKGQRCT